MVKNGIWPWDMYDWWVRCEIMGIFVYSKGWLVSKSLQCWDGLIMPNMTWFGPWFARNVCMQTKVSNRIPMSWPINVEICVQMQRGGGGQEWCRQIIFGGGGDTNWRWKVFVVVMGYQEIELGTGHGLIGRRRDGITHHRACRNGWWC